MTVSPFLIAGALVLLAATVLALRGVILRAFYPLAIVSQILIGIGNGWPGGLISAVVAVILAWMWWRLRRRRDRAPRAYGAKSRARMAALAAKAREALRPRPVLRPVPQGSR